MKKTKAQLQTELQNEALNVIGDSHNVSVEIGTGGGKTLLGLKHMSKNFTDYSSFLVVYPKKSIKDEWIKNANEHGYQYLLDHITFTTYRSLDKQKTNYDIVYMDECHSLKYSHQEWLDTFNMGSGYIIGLSGTYPKSGEKKEMCDAYCPKIFEYHVDKAIEDGMLNNYTIWVHMLKLDTKHTVIKKKKNGGTWRTSELKDYQWITDAIDSTDNPKHKQSRRMMRMQMIKGFPTKVRYVKEILNKIPHKVLVFANTKEQADDICKYSYHSSNKKSEENLELFSKDLIYRLSCVEQLSEGISIKNLRVGILMHAYANETKTRQKIGRFLRLNPDDHAIIHVLCYENSIDLHWVKSALKSFDPSKIKIHRP